MMLVCMMLISDCDEKEIFIKLFNTYEQDMFKQAYKILNDYQLAEDVVQECFLDIAKNFDSFKFKSISLDTQRYLMIIAKNRSIDYYRKKKKENFANEVDEIIDDLSNVEDLLEVKSIENYYESLPQEYQTILSLKYRFGYKYDEIAKHLEISKSTVKKRISKAKKLFKEILNEKESD